MSILLKLAIWFGGLVGLLVLAGSMQYEKIAQEGRVYRPMVGEALGFNWDDIFNNLSGVKGDHISRSTKNIKAVPILMYHYVRDVNKDDDPFGWRLSISPKVLESHLKTLKKAGFQTITFKNFFADTFDDKSVILTFDDGYHDFYTQVWPLLKKYQMTATIFVVTDFMQRTDGWYLNKEQIKELHDFRVEIGAHSVSHSNLTEVSSAQLNQEIGGSKEILETLIGDEVEIFAYPSGRYNNRVRETVAEHGYKGAVTTTPGLASLESDPFTLPRLRMTNDITGARLIEKLEELLGKNGA